MSATPKGATEMADINMPQDDLVIADKRNLVELARFPAFAVFTYFLYTSIIIAAEDILGSTSIPTSATIVCLHLPYFLMALILPYCIDRLSLTLKVVAAIVFFAVAVLVISLVDQPGRRLVGVSIASLGIGTIEIGILQSQSSEDGEFSIHSFLTGTGLGSVLGVVFYTVTTTVLCVNPKISLLSLLLILPMYPLIAFLVKRYTKNRGNTKESGDNSEHTPIISRDSDQINLEWTEKLQVAKTNMQLAVSLSIGLFSAYAIIQAVVTTISFKNSPFSPRDHYQYYILTFWAAEVIGRSYGLLVRWVKPHWVAVTEHTWILSLILFGNFIFLVISTWYRILPNYGVVLLFCVVTGATEGALHLNTFAVAEKQAQARHKEFSRAFLNVMLLGGIITAGLVGLWLEQYLQDHCKDIVSDKIYCFTRPTHGWNSNSSCI